jgi:hypothetical protein
MAEVEENNRDDLLALDKEYGSGCGEENPFVDGYHLSLEGMSGARTVIAAMK